MSLKQAQGTETLWTGKPTFVGVFVPIKELRVGWVEKAETPLKTLVFDAEKDMLSLIVNGKICVDIILVTGSATFYHINRIQKFRHMIQLFADMEESP